MFSRAGSRKDMLVIVCGLSAVLALTVLCYWPSLSGPFIFDDIPNLELLGERGGLSSADRYFEYISSGLSGPLGRPITLASFTIDGQTWPADPRPFRTTNLLIHLCNGLLVFFLARLIFLSAHKPKTAELLALICTTLWVLHPLLVSTTAYVVQRMTLLSSFFVLCGLLCYFLGRHRLSIRPLSGWAWILLGMGASGLLALFSKESGILLPFYALVLEFTLFKRSELHNSQRKLLLALFCTPILCLVAYVVIDWAAINQLFEYRPFTASERLMTQAPVLLDYLRQALAPQLSGLGIIHDDYPISRGLLNPVSTLLSVVIIAGSMAFAVLTRKRWPFIGFGILWFFIGHSLEAGPFALELYFEHRNYLPLLGPIVAICSFLPSMSLQVRRVLPVLLTFLIVIESFLTWQAAATWGSEEKLMQTALLEHPDSLRAQQYVANRYIVRGQYSEALLVQESLAKKHPKLASIHMSILNLRCLTGELTKIQIGSTLSILQSTGYDMHVIGYLGPLIGNAESGTCHTLGFAEVHSIFDALLSAPIISKNSKIRGAILYHKGLGYKKSGNLDEAVTQLDLSYAANPEVDVLIRLIVWLLDAERIDGAQQYLLLAQDYSVGRIWKTNPRSGDLAILQARIDLAQNRRQ